MRAASTWGVLGERRAERGYQAATQTTTAKRAPITQIRPWGTGPGWVLGAGCWVLGVWGGSLVRGTSWFRVACGVGMGYVLHDG
jgi:hypothetical protein